MKTFCDNCNLTGFIKQPTSYKNPYNLTYIDLILSNTSNATRFSLNDINCHEKEL